MPGVNRAYRQMEVGHRLLLASVFYVRFIRKAVEPAFSGLGRSDNGVSAGSCVFAGMTVRRGVAAKRDTASLAGAEMNPRRVDLHTLLALVLFGVLVQAALMRKKVVT